MLKRFPFSPILGWSVSRFDTFSFCKRKYYYTYYGKFDREFPIAKITQLKNLTTEALSIGSLAHDVIEAILKRLQKSTDVIDETRMKGFVKAQVQKYMLDKVFSEVYYKEREEIDEAYIIDSVFKAVMIFVKSERFEWIRQLPDTSKQQWIIEPDGYGETRIKTDRGDLKAYCKVDFMLPDGKDIYILDWKTGKADEFKHRKQLIGYSLFASFHFENKFDRIIPILAYLKDGYSEVVPQISEMDIENFKSDMIGDIRAMQNMNVDIENNTPVAKNEFTLTESEGKCKYCEFRELCGRN
ncbi:MAG: PD-(D/E)XK nuclease family protein [Flavobacteriales bacterium]|nr:PD-(D/E)XK nuclease family protein [Flavobacteriales bacterium]MDP4716238.1 PD-(D/E)XK nuclease family protein [Flavobacteriales bacterium]MDP4732188.1 PD-(D/E)XK nuclease family protein [Flavobacteriales bacterium]MDP4818283.1 PD-(D/E)XK nuclease family protein [Flavobacteriales bacterium]MDP4950699.1 PD-(D/E)XK nuclease family protein [Flavobacteriales bacterium]